MYSGVAEMYHEFRPRYPEDLVDEAIQKTKLLQDSSQVKILEIGCGPGTLTMPLATGGFNVVAIDPGIGMIEKAKQVCKEYTTTVEFRLETFKKISSDEKYDARIAASSLHWALAEEDKDKLIEKMSNLLKDDGTLLLFWNFPPEPSDQILDKLAEALDKPKTFHFENGSMAQHWQRMQERVLGPVEDSPFFEKFETTENSVEESIPIENYIRFLNTLSNYITIQEEER
jgi:SAM-dependent methyltransferase